ncbi:hypothetical protein CC2G_013016 [Coprinopsis cinerea AmutBmut pab1-1]|nr:hypothetical protein CC2G_004946 [Coprinopsis cinerea AmutBmut pab1-1]KAG2010173.1 hypothetical protein CC2G_013016 [Coprinopsis cinerea AmutBmut pab1-1]
MFSLARRPHNRVCKPLARCLAQVAPNTPSNDVSTTPASTSADWRTGKVPVRDDHGLYGFFRRKADPSLSGEDAYETVESARKPASGRAWRASELRLKSFQDLHTLWYVTLRERNLLATQREEARRMGIKINLQAQTVMAGACRKTMARIKAVMNERRLAYQGAVKLIKEHQEQIEDKKLLQLRHDALIEAQQELTAFTKQGRILRRQRLRQEAQARKALEEEGLLKAASETTEAAESSTNAEASSTPAAEATQAVPEPAKESESAPAAPEASSRPQTAAETATAGLFGDVPNRK